MKFTAATALLFATLALANPAPVTQPETRDQLTQALAPRADAPALSPEIEARAAGIRLDSREPKSKPKTPKNGNDTQDAAGMITPSRALQLGALGLGVMEVVRLWG